MATLQSVFLATTLKSEHAKVAQYMELMNLDRVAFFVVRDPSKELQEAFFESIHQLVLTRIPLVSKRHPKARRMLYICLTRDNVPDTVYLETYRWFLRDTFGPKCRYTVRVCHRYLKEALV